VTQRNLSLFPYRRASFNGGIIGVYHRYGVITTLLVDVLLSILLSADPLDVRQSSNLLDGPQLLDMDIKANCSAVAYRLYDCSRMIGLIRNRVPISKACDDRAM
jgi:hypothetical protein